MRWSLGVIGGLVTLAVAAILALPAAIENRTLAQLAEYGIHDAGLEVRSIGWRSSEIRDLRIGDDLRVDRIDVIYELGGLLTGRIARIDLAGARLRVTASGGGELSFGILDRLIEGRPGQPDDTPTPASGATPATVPIDIVALHDAEVVIVTPLGPVSVTLDGEAVLSDGPTIDAVFDTVLIAAQGSMVGRIAITMQPDAAFVANVDIVDGELTHGAVAVQGLRGLVAATGGADGLSVAKLDLNIAEIVLPAGRYTDVFLAADLAGDTVSANAGLQSADGSLTLTAAASVDDITSLDSPFRLAGELDVAASTSLGQLAPGLEGAAGTGRAAFSLAGSLPGQAVFADPLMIFDRIDTLALSGWLDFALDAVSLPGIASGLTADGRLSAEAAAGEFTLTSDDGLRFAVAAIDPALLAAFDPGAMAAGYASQPFSIALGDDGPPFFVYARHRGASITVSLVTGWQITSAAGPSLVGMVDAAAELAPDGSVRLFTVPRLAFKASGLDIGGAPLTVRGLRINLAGTPAAASGTMALRLAAAGGAAAGMTYDAAALTAVADITYGAGGLALTLLDGTHAAAAQLAMAGAAVVNTPRLDAAGDLYVDLAATPIAASGGLALRFVTADGAVAGMAYDDVELTAAADFTYHGDGLALTLLDGTKVTVAGLALADVFTTTEAVVLAIETPDGPSLEIAPDDGGGALIRYDLSVSAERLAAALTGDAIPVVVGAARLDVRGAMRWPAATLDGTAVFSAATVALPDNALALEDVGADVSLAGAMGQNGRLASISIGTLRQTGEAARWFTPLTADGVVDRDGAAFVVVGRVADKSGVLGVDVDLRHEDEQVDARIVLNRLRFAPDGLRPQDLAPRLAGLVNDLSGTIAADVRLAWSGAALSGDMTLLIEDVSLEAGPARFESVNAVIEFDEIWPPSTPPGQLIAIGLVDAGLPLTDGVIEFELLSDRRVAVERARWHWAGGTLGANNFIFDLDAAVHEVELAATDLDLGKIAQLAGVPNLSATGQFSGRVPIAVSEAGLVIDGGVLDAGPAGGALRYAPDGAPAALRQAGDAAVLALTALENFEYETLRITIDREAAGETNVGLHIRGANPNLFDGFPIEFNLNISGELDTMLRRGLEGYRVPDAIVERIEKFGR